MVEKKYGKKQRTRSQIGKASKNRGKVGEREVVHLLRKYGYEARRGQQFAGSPDSPDVISSFFNSHIEVKRTEALSLYKAMEQAKDDASEEQMPMLFHKRNNQEWLIVMEADELLSFIDSLMADNI